MPRLERRLRLVTGLIVACFVVPHFLNHSLGVVSIDAMDRLRAPLAAWWRSAPGTVLLYGALLTHFALALVSLYRRTTLRMPRWEAAQLVLGRSCRRCSSRISSALASHGSCSATISATSGWSAFSGRMPARRCAKRCC